MYFENWDRAYKEHFVWSCAGWSSYFILLRDGFALCGFSWSWWWGSACLESCREVAHLQRSCKGNSPLRKLACSCLVWFWMEINTSCKVVLNVTCLILQVEVKGVVLVGVSLSREVIPAFARILLHTPLRKKHMVRPLLRTEITQVINRRAWYDATKLTTEVLNLYKVSILLNLSYHWCSFKLNFVKFIYRSDTDNHLVFVGPPFFIFPVKEKKIQAFCFCPCKKKYYFWMTWFVVLGTLNSWPIRIVFAFRLRCLLRAGMKHSMKWAGFLFLLCYHRKEQRIY